MNLSELLPFLEKINARPNRRFSQNFLIDSNIVQKIVHMADIRPGDKVLEIGPGPGALTRALLAQGAHVLAIEIDTAFATALRDLDEDRLTVFEADFLSFPMHQIPKDIKVVANLPYHITTPILDKLFHHPFVSITVMVQKEVADRMTASAGSKQFGALTLFVQFYTKLIQHFLVPASCFYPRPQVNSTVIRLDAQEPPSIEAAQFFPWIKKSFQQRRKMLSTSLGLAKDTIRNALATIGVREDARPESLSFAQWVSLAKLLNA